MPVIGPLSHVTASLIGLGTGVLSGCFGVGGGVVMTPAIRLLLDTQPLLAVGTTLCVTLPSALSGGLRYSRQGLVDHRVARWAALAGVPASIAASLATKHVPGSSLMLVLAAVVAGVGLDIVTGARERRMMRARHAIEAEIARARLQTIEPEVAQATQLASESEPGTVPRAEDAAARPKWLLTGAIVGFASGFLGIGGGVLAVPIFLSWLRMPIKRAFGTSLILVALLATPGSIVHFLLGHVDIPLVILLTLGVIPGAWVGAGLASRISDSRLIRAFGFFLLAVALAFGFEELRGIAHT